MRKPIGTLVIVAFFASSTGFSPAQQAARTLASGPSWERVEAVLPGSIVFVHTNGHSTPCKMVSADAASLTCVGGDVVKTEVFQKRDIKKITVPHRGRSTLVGLAVGVGVGAGAGVGVGESQASTGSIGITKGQATAVFVAIGGVVFGLIGAIVGALTDFTGSTIYKG